MSYGKFFSDPYSSIKAADRKFDINEKMKITNKTLFLLADMFQLFYQHNTNWQYAAINLPSCLAESELCDDELLCDDE